jgi:trehalose/maltose hydrolase-like predicted phosphorylase
MRNRVLLVVVCCAQALTTTILAAQQSPPAVQDSGFVLSTDDPRRSPSPFIGNGHLGVTIPALGIGASPSIMAGMYEEAAGDVPRIVSLPAWNAIEVFDGKRWLTPRAAHDSSISAYRQVLDLRSGTVRTSYHWTDGPMIMSVRVETFISRAEPGLSAIRLTLAPQYRRRLRVRFAIVGWPPPGRLALATLEKAAPDWRPADIWYPGHLIIRSRSATSGRGGARLSAISAPEGRETTTLAQAAAITWSNNLPGISVSTTAREDTARVEVAFNGSRGRVYTFTQIVAHASSLQEPQPLSRAIRLAQLGRVRGYAGLAADNAKAWRQRWATDIEVQGDPELQRVVRSMLFYLLCSADAGTSLGIPPMGLSSAGYYGHIFWDSDTWMFPSLLVTHPDVARSLVSFRSRTLPAAQANAQANGYRGAMYPWEADERGRETTPHFAVQNARSEIHVTGDVALAQWQYYLITGDSAWLAREGYPVMRETADFWVSRATLDSAAGQYHIKNVVSVSEGLIGVSDDAYTNAVARKNLEIASLASRRLGAAPDPRWEQVGAKLHMPYDSVSEFFRTYEGAPDSTLGDVTPLLAYPLSVPMSERAKRSQLEQAARRLLAEGPGAMMGSTLLSVDAAELGDRALIDSLLPHSYQGHLKGPFLMLSETPKNNAVNFVTGAGGFLQQVIYGYTGLRLRDEGLEPAFPAILPSKITRLVLRNVYSRGKRYDVVVDSGGRRITPHKNNSTR